ncbi:MAG TPA: ABC transporter ATP-binding protein [Thermoanaerobaculia bacterium]|nr:ABC transporter ATP-binding protein [Thermoanaerobaculia bacterium]
MSDWSVEVHGVTKRFEDVSAVDGVTLQIRRGEFFSLLGPSGCGKTTLLRLVAGLELPSAGTIAIGGAAMTAVPAHRRPVNLVFQQYALFPHLTVAENVAFGLRYQNLPRTAQAARVTEALALVRLEGMERRRPDQLSGGQRQRVALARALALTPQVLLLDEPLSALDRKLREEMQVELKGLQRRVGITFLLVTHDQEEALAMSDRVAVMHQGRVEQVGTPAEVYETPATPFVASFLGASNFWTAEVRAVSEKGLTLALTGGAEIVAPAPEGRAFRTGETVQFLVRPEKLVLTASPQEGPALPVTVEERIYQGASTTWIVRDERGERISVYAQNAGGRGEGLEPGRGGFLSWEPRFTVVVG